MELIKFEINEERRNVINRNLVSFMRPKRMIKYLAKGVDNTSKGIASKMSKGLNFQANNSPKPLTKDSINLVKKPS